jgi:polyisoprenoid-binding protein YceI
MLQFIRCASLLILLHMLIACQPSTRKSAGELAELRIPAASQVYVIDSSASLLVVKVYKAGSLAKLGHNHVISSRDLQGEVYLSEVPESSAVEIRLPVATLDVDLPEMRAAAGAAFAAELDAAAVQGTRQNLLGERQLDAVNAPRIILRSRTIEGAYPEFMLTADLAFRTHISRVAIPVSIKRTGDQLVVSGAFKLAQTSFGMEPFSVMMGALQVQDELEIEFTLVAASKLATRYSN